MMSRRIIKILCLSVLILSFHSQNFAQEKCNLKTSIAESIKLIPDFTYSGSKTYRPETVNSSIEIIAFLFEGVESSIVFLKEFEDAIFEVNIYDKPANDVTKNILFSTDDIAFSGKELIFKSGKRRGLIYVNIVYKGLKYDSKSASCMSMVIGSKAY